MAIVLKTKIAFVDVCGTLVDLNTMNKYIEYFFNKNNFFLKQRVLINLFKALSRVGFLRGKKLRNAYLNMLKNIDKNSFEKYIDQFFYDHCKYNLNYELLDFLYSLQKKGYKIIIVSASLMTICKMISLKLKFDAFICTNLEVINNKFTGKTVGGFCEGMKKVESIKNFLQVNSMQTSNTIGFGNSIEDKEMLSFCQKSYVIWANENMRVLANKYNWLIGVNPLIDTY